jgi:Fanconi anemia group M protein
MQLVPRAYQLAIYNSVLQNGNTLVILPTGLGKTMIALMLIRDKIKHGRCLFLAPTKPLAKQHYNTVKENLGIEGVVLVTGETNPEKRREQYKNDVIIGTPQTLKNDLENNVVTNDFALCVIDEAHRAVKNYAYTYVANALREKTLILGLTASPGGRKDRIEDVTNALGIKNLEIRTHEDEDVKPYVQQSEIKWVTTELSPTLKLIKSRLDGMIASHAARLAKMGFPPPLKSKGMFMQLRHRIMNMKSGVKYTVIVQYSILLNLLHMVELLETQGLYSLREYIAKIEAKESKSAKLLLANETFKEVVVLANSATDDHPKLKLLLEIVKSLEGKKAIVFAQYRSQIKLLESELVKNGISAKQFVGKRDGVTRKIQEATIADFRDGKFNVLVASSIGEEGLDIPSVDAVIFYEPVPSEIRSIQRRGRAARLKSGEIYILMTKDTRDEYYYWSAFNKEKKMKQIVSGMQRRMTHERKKKEGTKDDIDFMQIDKVEKKYSKKEATEEKQTRMSEFI